MRPLCAARPLALESLYEICVRSDGFAQRLSAQAMPWATRATAVLPRQCVYHPDLELGQYEELLASVLLDASIR
jgi:hypothetical protein